MNTKCKRCGALQTIEHILFHCRFARDVWNYGPWNSPLNLSQVSSFFKKLQASYNLIMLPPFGVLGNTFPWLCWTIWIARNHLLFENRHASATSTAPKAILAQKEWKSVQPNRPRSSPKVILPPPQVLSNSPHMVFCNTDASWKSDLQAAGLARIFTDHNAKRRA